MSAAAKIWTTLSAFSNLKYEKCLSAFLNEQGCPNTFEETKIDPNELQQFLPIRVPTKFYTIRIGNEYASTILSSLTHTPSQLQTLQAADSLVFDGNVWWPRNYLYEALVSFVASTKKGLDLFGSVLIIGSQGHAKTVVAALAKVGFQKFNFVDATDQDSEDLINFFRKNYFKIEFQIIPRLKITQLPGIHSVVVNNLDPHQDTKDLQIDLAYFNFLKNDGLWLELELESTGPELLQEAIGAGAQVLLAADILAERELIWSEQTLGFKSAAEDFRLNFKAAIAQLSHDHPLVDS